MDQCHQNDSELSFIFLVTFFFAFLYQLSPGLFLLHSQLLIYLSIPQDANIAMADYPYSTSFLADLPAFPARVFCANVTSPLTEEINTDEEIVKRIIKGTNVFFNYTGQTECFDIGSEGKKRPSNILLLNGMSDHIPNDLLWNLEEKI